MATSAGLVDVLKRELRTRGVTYAHVARKLGLSEASVKRMFSRKDFSLKRLDQVCQLASAEFSDLARALYQEESLISQLTYEQEKEIVSNRKLFLAAVCVLNHVEGRVPRSSRASSAWRASSRICTTTTSSCRSASARR